MGQKRGTNWTEEELVLLADNYDRGALYCSSILNRSIKAIRKRANDIGLSKVSNKAEYNKHNLVVIISECYSLSEVINRLGLRNAGGNFNTIKKYIKLYNIDTTHFTSAENRLEGLKNYKDRYIKLSNDNLFIENSKSSRSSVKNRIYKENLLPILCVMCGQDELWRGQKMSLILDHINGISNDHRLSNLRLLCPNCNATLDTHCGKHKTTKNAILILENNEVKIKKREKVDKRKLNRNIYNEEQEKYINDILNSGIDFSKHGWVNKVAPIINKSYGKVNIWMKRFMPDFYESSCFKRKRKINYD